MSLPATDATTTPDATTTSHVAAQEANVRRWWILAVVAVAQLMIVLDSSIVNIALPQAQQALRIGSLSQAQWVITAYALAFGGLLLLGGRIADLLGRKRTFLVGLLGFAAASALGGAAVSGVMLVAARGLQGAFAAMLAPAALSIIATTFIDQRERSVALAVYGGIAGGGAVVGLLLGGVLTEYASWRWCLLVNIPIAALAAVAGARLLVESRTHGPRHLDTVGAVLSVAGLVGLVYGTTLAADPDHGWASVEVIAVLVAAVVLLAAFVAWESRVTSPLLPLRVPSNRDRGTAYACVLLVGLGLFGMFLFLTYYFQQNLRYTPLQAGLAFLPFSIGFLISAGLASQLMPRLGPKPLMLTGLPIAAASLIGLCTISMNGSLLLHVLLPELGISLGMGVTFIALSAVALHDVADDDAGVASALLNASQQIGGAVGTAVLSTIYVSRWQSWLTARHLDPLSTATGPQPTPQAAIAGYQLVFAVAAALLIIAWIAVAAFVHVPRNIAAPSPAPQ